MNDVTLLSNPNQEKRAEIPWTDNDEGYLGKLNPHGHGKVKEKIGVAENHMHGGIV